MRILVSTFLVFFLVCTIAIIGEPEHSITSDIKSEDSTALTQAILENDTDRVRLILKYGIDLDLPADVELASAEATKRTTKQAISAVDFINKIQIFHDKTTPLMLAASMHNSHEIVSLLLEAGADPNTTDEVGRTSLILCSLYSGSSTVARTLLDHGVDVNATMDNGLSPLYGACLNTQPADLIQLLLEHGANPNTPIPINGSTPLMEAAEKYRDTTVIDLLLKFGADIHAESFKGHTAFYLACAWNHSIEAIDLLYLAGGGKDHRLNKDGLSRTPLMSAALDSTPEVVQYLISIGADVNLADDRGNTALMLAAMWNTPNVVSLLINAGAKLEAREQNGATPLLLACKYNDTRMIRKLLDAGAEPRVTNYEGFGYADFAEIFKTTEEAESVNKLFENEMDLIP